MNIRVKSLFVIFSPLPDMRWRAADLLLRDSKSEARMLLGKEACHVENDVRGMTHVQIEGGVGA